MAQQTLVDVSGAARRSAAAKNLAANIRERITSRALVTLQRRLGPEVSREIGEVLNLPKREISSRVTVTKSEDHVDVTASGKRIPLRKFGGQWGVRSTAGATARIFIDGESRTYVSAFALPKGTIVARALAGEKRTPRLPLTPLYGPDIGSVLVSRSAHGIQTGLNSFAFDTLSTELERSTTIEMDSL